jgi:hypothetical protein
MVGIDVNIIIYVCGEYQAQGLYILKPKGGTGKQEIKINHSL